LDIQKIADDYWNSLIKGQIMDRFEYGLAPEEINKPFGMRSVLKGTDVCFLFSTVQKMLGFKFFDRVNEIFSHDPKTFDIPNPFDETDLEELGEKVKSIDIVDVAQAYVLKSKAKSNSAAHPTRLLKLAAELLEDVLHVDPSNLFALIHMADCLKELGDNKRAEIYYRRAIRIDPEDVNLLRYYAVFLEQINKYSEAEDYYIQALELEPNHAYTLQKYGEFLDNCLKNSALAEKFYFLASAARSKYTSQGK